MRQGHGLPHFLLWHSLSSGLYILFVAEAVSEQCRGLRRQWGYHNYHLDASVLKNTAQVGLERIYFTE